MPTTLGREILRSRLPDQYKSLADRTWDKKTSDQITTQMAQDDPDAYIDILQDLNNFGQTVVSTYGRDAALPFRDLKVSANIRNINAKIRQLIDKILDDDRLTDSQKEQKITELGYKYTQKVEDAVFDDMDKRNTALASQINSGARGKKVQLRQMLFGDMLMKDALNRDMPYLMMDAYADGATPTGYWVSASSGRKGYYDVQMATGQSGYLGKRVTAATHDTIISEDDCGTTDTGVPFPANSTSNIGAVLLKPFHDHPAGSIVDSKMVAEADDDEEMILRSPMTCKSKIGVCAKCNGLGENGRFPGVGEYVSLNAARSFVEPVTQGAVGCLAPDTLVRMADGSDKEIKDIQIGDQVIGVSVTGVPSIVTVTRTYTHGLMPMYKWSYRTGGNTHKLATLVATENHKALQSTQKTNCKDAENNNIPRILPVGTKARYIGMVPLQQAIPTGDKRVEEALYLGLMLGDGCYTDGVYRRPHFSCADPSLIEDITPYLSTLGIKCVFHKGSDCYYRMVNKNEANISGQVRELNPAKLLLDKHGLLGKYAHEKQLPADYMTWDNASLSALVSGLIITDGCLSRLYSGKHYPYVSYASTSLAMVEQVRKAIFYGCGASCSAIKVNKSARKRTLYSISYNKRATVYKLLNWLKLYGIKETRRIQYLEELTNWKASASTGELILRWPLAAKEMVGMVEAYDIEVDHPDHLFLLSNGMIVSNSKHAGGIGGKKVINPEGEDQPTGFRSLERMFTTPSNFPGGAVLAPVDGTVSKIQPAAQGGTYVTVGNKTLYCSPYRTIKVKEGDKVYAGDVLTNGVPNPMELVALKGLGAGRVYFTKQLGKILKESGWGTERRNLESFSRAFLNKVEITNPDGYHNFLPGDTVNYSEIMADYEPRDNSEELEPSKAIDQYLEKPVLYYSIGTRITPEVAADLKKYQFNSILVNKEAPPFASKFMRPAEGLQKDKNWLPRLSGERLKEGLFDAARQGITDPYDSPSYVDKIIINPLKPN